MNIAIVDDEPIFLEMIQDYLNNITQYEIETYSFISVHDMEKSSVLFDLLLLDIDMPDCDGIEYSKMHRDKKIIFVTNYGMRMKEAFGFNVYGFIEKSDSCELFCEKVMSVIEEIMKERTISLKTDLGMFSFLVKDIVYGQYLSNRRVSFVVDNKVYIYKGKTLQEFVDMLGDGFSLIDRDTFVNMEHVIGVVGNQVILRNIKHRLTTSARRQKEIKELFLRRR